MTPDTRKLQNRKKSHCHLKILRNSLGWSKVSDGNVNMNGRLKKFKDLIKS